MKDKKITVYFPFLPILTLIFITFKLCKVITWSWLWILAPTWIPLAFVVIMIIIIYFLKR